MGYALFSSAMKAWCMGKPGTAAAAATIETPTFGTVWFIGNVSAGCGPSQVPKSSVDQLATTHPWPRPCWASAQAPHPQALSAQ